LFSNLWLLVEENFISRYGKGELGGGKSMKNDREAGLSNKRLDH
jgi:hypothetical protein